MARSLNKVQLIGNVTKDIELRQTEKGSAVCSFSIATNRSWTNDKGENKEETEFHQVVAWSKLAEIIAKYVHKGSKLYVSGRLQTRKWEDKEGKERQTTEVIIDDMIMLDKKDPTNAPADDIDM